MRDDITFPERLTAAVPVDLYEAARRCADRRGLTLADYVRRSLQASLTLDGERFQRLPDLQRLTSNARMIAR